MPIGLSSLARAARLSFASPGADTVNFAPDSSEAPRTLPARVWTAWQDNLTAERDRWLPWGVAAFAAGAAFYFALPDELACLMVWVVGFMAVTALAIARMTHAAIICFLCALIAGAGLGFTAAKWRTERIAAPVVTRDTGPLRIEGRIENVFVQDATHVRIVLAPTKMGRETENLPRRVRITLRGEKAVAAVAPGVSISQLAMLRPPPEPAQPGGYDFARWAYYSGIGGVGFGLGGPQIIGEIPTRSWTEDFAAWIEQLRLSMSTRIRAGLPGPEGAIAAALIAGDRAAISEADNEAYRDSGLFHVLSISGLHMALAGLGVFWIVRALLALWPRVALTQPIKKWASVAALLAATFYLFISGAGAPAVRSYIMLSAMLLAVLADRPALNMRAVAISALLILAVEPEGAIEPSFQMSFAAIIGLIALAEWQRGLPKIDSGDAPRFFRALRWARRYFTALILTSVIAGLATAPFAIYHFDRAPGYSLLANLLATPVVGLVIMPSACFTVATMPFGLEYWPLQAMGWGVRAMTDIAHYVASLPGAVRLLPAWSSAVLALIVFGGLWLGLWQRNWRWFGLAPVAIGLMLSFAPARPDILIARDAGGIAVRGGDGRFMLIGDVDDYTAEQWLLRDGDSRTIEEARSDAGCDEYGCVVKDAKGRLIAFARRVGALRDDCERADVLVSNVPLRRPCLGPQRVVDRFEILDGGAIALWLGDGTTRSLSVAETRGRRPWATKASGID